MIRVPYSRINGLYMMERGVYNASSATMIGMYAGPDENEVCADTHGLPIYFIKAGVGDGEMLSFYMKQFEQYEKNNP